MGSLAAGIGHELNNVTQLFCATLEMVKRRAGEGQAVDPEDLQSLDTIGAHLANHGAHLLAAARPGTTAPETFDVHGIVETTLAITAEACVGAPLGLPIPFLPGCQVVASCGINEAPRRVVVSADTTIRLDPSWHIISQTVPAAPVFRDRCELTAFRVDVTDFAATFVAQQVTAATQRMDATVTQHGDLTPRAQELWSNLSAPMDLGDGFWLTLSPQRVFAAPFELTTVTGTRIRDRLTLFLEQKKPREAIEGVIMVGLANNYLQYAATSDEYNLQHYEGASTLYGPETARFLGNHLLCLADSLYGDHADSRCILAQPHAVNTVHPVLANPQQVSRMPDVTESIVDPVQLIDEEIRSTRIDLWPTWTVRFRGNRPGAGLMRNHITVRILEAGTSRLLDDDDGTGIEVRFDETAEDEQTWMARWTPRGAYCKERAYFVIGTTTPIVSRSFQLSCPGNVTDVEDRPNPRLDQDQTQDQRDTAPQQQRQPPPSAKQDPSAPTAPRSE